MLQLFGEGRHHLRQAGDPQRLEDATLGVLLKGVQVVSQSAREQDRVLQKQCQS